MGATVAANRVSLKQKVRREDGLFLFNTIITEIETIRNGVSGFKIASRVLFFVTFIL